MRIYFILAAIALQVLVLVYMAGQREYILATGERVYLRTAPIDPRDPFRGDFVRLRYAISDINPTAIDPTLEELPRGLVVYAVLERDAGNIARLLRYSLQAPDSGLYLRGRTRQRWASHYSQTVQVDYGIETYFVQQGRGLDIEQRQGLRNTMQIPLEMELAVSASGTAIIKGHRWSSLGIQLEILPRETSEDTPAPEPMLKLSLLNASAGPLTLIDLPEYCSFSLEPALQWSQTPWTLAHDPCASIEAQAQHLVVLQAGEIFSVVVDLALSRWHVNTQEGETVAIGSLPNERFRLVYRPPEASSIPRAVGSPPVWQGELASGAFTATGRVD